MCHQRMSNRWGNALVLCLLLVGIQQLSGAAIIKAKAWLAPLLIELAWVETLQLKDSVVKPWPWADTWPVGRLQIASLGLAVPRLSVGIATRILRFCNSCAKGICCSCNCPRGKSVTTRWMSFA